MKTENHPARTKNRAALRTKPISLIRSNHHWLCILLLRGRMHRLDRRGAALSSRKMVALGKRISKHSVMLQGMVRQIWLPRKRPVCPPCASGAEH